MRPYVSVIVIGYNIEKYIEECIESILLQTFNNYEIIFVNDGSTDDTLKIVSKYKNRIKIIDKTNGGIVSARKTGLKVAVGEYVTFIDGDDWLNVDFLSNLYSPILLNPEFDIVCSDFFYQEPDGSFRREKCSCLSSSFCRNYDFFDGIMIEQIDHHMFPKLYKKDFILNAGYLDYPEVTMAEDWMTNAFFGLFKPNVFYTNTINYFYRFNRNSVLRKGGKKLLEQIDTLNYMEKFFQKNCEFDYRTKMDFVWFSYTRAFLLANTEPSVKKEIVRVFKQKHITYKDNPYCLADINRFKKKRKLKFWLELNVPSIISVVDYLHDLIKKIDSIKDNNLYYEKKSEALYDSYIESLERDQNLKKIYLIGTSDRSNIGDHAIALSEINILNDIFEDYTVKEITGDTFRNRRDAIKEIINQKDIIFVTGGGFLGDLWPDEEYMVNAVLEDYRENKVIILPQTIYFYDEADSLILRKKIENYTKHKNLYLTARDKKTYDFYARYFEKDKIGLFPDMALYLEKEAMDIQTNDVMICLRADKESVISTMDEITILDVLKDKELNIIYGSTLADGVHNGDIILSKREAQIKLKLEEFSKPRFIITDRLHGMILSTLAGTPCIVFDNLSKKVSGVYDLWLKDSETIVFCDNVNSFKNEIDKVLQMKHFRYSTDYLKIEKKNFVKFIKSVVEEK